MAASRSFVIGDVHGQYDRLEALLIKAFGEELSDSDVEIISLGDLGDFRRESVTGDYQCYEAADEWLDFVLWGNHDRAIVDEKHWFSGYWKPPEETIAAVMKLKDEGRMPLALERHGFLLTHAGLHKAWKLDGDSSVDGTDPAAIAAYLNSLEHVWNPALLNGISRRRGGMDDFGGILWRDASEKLWDGVRQIFGHSKGQDIRSYGTKNVSYCIDVRYPDNGRLAGVMLPELEVIEVEI